MGKPATTAPRPRRSSGRPVPDPRELPWAGLSLAAQAGIEHLAARLPMDLWLVTHREHDRQVVMAATGPWSTLVPRGSSFAWSEGFCSPMVSGEAPVWAPDVRREPAYARQAVGRFARVRAYLGVPLVGEEGDVPGTVCAFAGTPGADDLGLDLDLVRLVARMLSTVLARERLALERSRDAAAAYALAERDRLTDLQNRRGWERALAQEQGRRTRYGAAPSLLVLDLDDLKVVNDAGGHEAGDRLLVRCAQVLRGTCRPGDTLARLGGDEFGLLAVECDQAALGPLVRRVRAGLEEAHVEVSVGAVTCRPEEDLEGSWRRADAAMYEDKRQRKAARA